MTKVEMAMLGAVAVGAVALVLYTATERDRRDAEAKSVEPEFVKPSAAAATNYLTFNRSWQFPPPMQVIPSRARQPLMMASDENTIKVFSETCGGGCGNG
jgi:hypothetical protein